MTTLKPNQTSSPQFLHRALLQQGGVAQIVSHHNGWIQGGEVQGGDRNAIISTKKKEEKSFNPPQQEPCVQTDKAQPTRGYRTYPFSGSMTVAPV